MLVQGRLTRRHKLQRARVRSNHSRTRTQLVLERATDLKPTRRKGADEEIHDTEEVMCFVELYVNGKAYISPVAEQGSAPEWQWPFYFPVEGEPAGEGCDVAARFTVYNFLAKEQPQVRRRRASTRRCRAAGRASSSWHVPFLTSPFAALTTCKSQPSGASLLNNITRR